MRAWTGLIGAAIAFCVATVPLAAQPAETIEASSAAAPATPTAHRLSGAIERALASIAGGSELAPVYAARGGAPLWLADDGGLTPSAVALADEIIKADDWGLDVRAFDLGSLAPVRTGVRTDEAAAHAEVALSRAVLTYARHAKGGRIDPSALSLWLDQRPQKVDATSVLPQIAGVADPAAALRNLHPQHWQFTELRKAWLEAKTVVEKPRVLKPRLGSGPVLKPGIRHPHVAVVREILEVPAPSVDDVDVYDPALQQAVAAVLARSGRKGQPLIGKQGRAVLNAEAARLSAPPDRIDRQKLLVNLERWRWMPADLGAMHIWNNLPEYTMRAVRSGTVVHAERIIIGKPETQTPIFSNAIQFVVAQPNWGVPETMKVRELLPHLRAGRFDILDKRQMRIPKGRRGEETLDPGEIDWTRSDIRAVSIVQDPGPSNPLGSVKFMFPNKHDVYMHDTPTKGLFGSAQRTFSNGCIRVRNPRRLAEILFAADRGWTPQQVAVALDRAEPNTRIDLKRSVPVHNTYFTIVAAADGRLVSLPDVYGHDKRVAAALAGTSVAVIAAADPAAKLRGEVDRTLAASPLQAGAVVRLAGVTRKPAKGAYALGGPTEGPPPSFVSAPASRRGSAFSSGL
jgi:murein L,D-transpeptidase YcbB/YkuD